MALIPREHVLLRMRAGDQFLRHGVILSAAVGTSHLILTPSRAIKDVDLFGASVVRFCCGTGLGASQSQSSLDINFGGQKILIYEVREIAGSHLHHQRVMFLIS